MALGRVRTRVLLADDSPQCLSMLAGIAARTCSVVAIARDGTSALELIRRLQPDVAVLDFDMPGCTGIDVVNELARESHQTAILICSVDSSDELVSAAREAGALGFVSKQCSARDLLPALEAVSQHRDFFPVNPAANTLHEARNHEVRH